MLTTLIKYSCLSANPIFRDGDTPEQRDALQRSFDFLGRYLKP
jgi:hypothetical protein